MFNFHIYRHKVKIRFEKKVEFNRIKLECIWIFHFFQEIFVHDERKQFKYPSVVVAARL